MALPVLRCIPRARPPPAKGRADDRIPEHGAPFLQPGKGAGNGPTSKDSTDETRLGYKRKPSASCMASLF